MKTFRKLSLALVTAALLVAVLAAACAGGAKPVAREPGKAYELVLLHTNDHHGRIEPVSGQGGLEARSTFINSVRGANRNVLLVDAGDLNTGTALANMFAGEIDILAYNLIGYEAMTFGNHEFNVDMARIERQVALSEFPWVSSNVRTADGGFLGGNQYLVKDYEGFRVGIIGLTTLRALAISNAHVMDVTFIPEIDAAREAVALLRDKELVDIVIALAHMGDVKEYDDHVTTIELANAVPGIDIIVDGHTHTKMEAPRVVGSTYIVSANEWGKFVGQGKLTIVDGKLVNFAWAPVEINTQEQKTYLPDPVVTAFLAPYLEKAEASLKEVIGHASSDFDFGNRRPRFGETAIGNMIVDANVWYFREVFNQQIDFAFHNGGNIRAQLNQGPITREGLLTVLPFDNFLYIVSMKGSDLQELFKFIATIPQGNGGFPQFSKEVRYTLDVPSAAISNLTIGGAPIDPNKTYRFCTNDFLLGGGDGYTVLNRAQDPYNTQLLLSYVVIEYIAALGGTITPATDGRINVIGGVTP